MNTNSGDPTIVGKRQTLIQKSWWKWGRGERKLAFKAYSILLARHVQNVFAQFLFCSSRTKNTFLQWLIQQTYAWSTQDACAEHDGCIASLLQAKFLLRPPPIYGFCLWNWSLMMMMTWFSLSDVRQREKGKEWDCAPEKYCTSPDDFSMSVVYCVDIDTEPAVKCWYGVDVTIHRSFSGVGGKKGVSLYCVKGWHI